LEIYSLLVLVLVALTYLGALSGLCFGAAYLWWSVGHARRTWLRRRGSAFAVRGPVLARERGQILGGVVTCAVVLVIASSAALWFFPLPVIPALGVAVILRANAARHRRPSRVGFWPVVALPAVSIPLCAFFVLRPLLPPAAGWWWVVAAGLATLVLAGALGFSIAVIQLHMLERHDRDVRDRYLETVGDSGTEAWASGRGGLSTLPTTQEGWVASLFDRPYGGDATYAGEGENVNV
jgi:hypothetical protein